MLNPYSKITSFVLYLYSMEFGTPPLYSDLNKAARAKNVDPNLLNNLGPFAQVLSQITEKAEEERSTDDKIKTGK